MIDSLGRKERSFFCYICKNIAWHVLINNKWNCECCNPLLMPDETLIGFTGEEVLRLRNRSI